LTDFYRALNGKNCCRYGKIVFDLAKRILDKTVATHASGWGAGRAKRPAGLPAPLPRGERRRRHASI